MKKILFLGLILTLFAVAATAQTRNTERFRNQRQVQVNKRGELNRVEVRHLRRDEQRFRIARRRAHRDRVVTPLERRRLANMKKDKRRDLYRFRHNRFRRVI